MRAARKHVRHDDHDMKMDTLVGMILKSEDRQAPLRNYTDGSGWPLSFRTSQS